MQALRVVGNSLGRRTFCSSTAQSSYMSFAEYARIASPLYLASILGFIVCMSTGENKKETTMSEEWMSANKEYRRFSDMDPMGLNGKLYTPSYMKSDA